MFRSELWRHFDFWLLGAVLVAMVFGVAMIRSALASNPYLADLVPRQIIFAALGFILILLVAAVDYHFWGAAIRWLYLVVMIFLIILYLTAGERFGAARWIETGLISIQPTELAKIVVILGLAYYFSQTSEQPHGWRWLFRSALIPAGLAIWIFLQPNLSNVIVIGVLWAAMAWVGGMKWQHAVTIAVVAVAGSIVIFPLLAGYQQDRIIMFFASDSTAERHGARYNVEQALIALGSGGWTGKGYGLGTQTQLRFLKVRHTDFIFSVIGEELGLAGTLLVILLLGFIIYRCLRVARLARDPFGSLIAYGVAVLLFFQGAVNVAVNLRLIPVTGLPLPFISYGGSGLVSLMIGIGLVESVMMRRQLLEF
jgi:rod shape determining protein RodA